MEHPVTEEITGVDLVEQMIRIAAGEKLALTQSDVQCNGWSFEARVYAEDPENEFLPSVGRLTRYQEPSNETVEDGHEGRVRCDSGVRDGDNISIHYDPMICKLITHGADRQSALAKMRVALDSYIISGVTHNISFLRALTDHPKFISGDITTALIEEEYPDGFKAPSPSDDEQDLLLGAAVLVLREQLLMQAGIATMESFDPEFAVARKLADLFVHTGQDE